MHKDSCVQVLRMKKLRGQNIILNAAKHNLREIQKELGSGGRIDALKIPLNVILVGASTAHEVSAKAENILECSGVKKLRKDAVRGLEIIFALPAKSVIEVDSFFKDSINWVRDYFNCPILTAIIHKDESEPHCHVIFLPLVNGKMNGSKLMGNKRSLEAIQANFHEAVGKLYGISRAKPVRRYSKSFMRQVAMDAVENILKNPKLLNNFGMRDALVESLAWNPMPLVDVLSLKTPELKAKQSKSFVEIMTKPSNNKKHIGFDRSIND